MAESTGQASQRRANWIGLRTLRQHPKYVGETSFGDAIYEVRSVRLTLRPDGSHFHLLTQCARCGRDVAGTQVFTPADLDHPSNPVICTDCVRKAGVSTHHPPEMTRPSARIEAEAQRAADEASRPAPRPAAPAPAVAPAHAPAPAPARPPDDSRLSVAEAQIQALLGQVRELAQVVRAEGLERRRAAEETRTQLQQVLQHQAEVRADPDATDDVRRSMGAIVEAIRGQRGEIATLNAALVDAHQEIRRLADSGNRLAIEQGDLRAHVAAAGAPGAAGSEGVTEDVVVALVEPRLQQVHASLGATVEARLAGVETTVADGLAQARFEMASLQERLDATVEARLAGVETTVADGLAHARFEIAALQERLDAALVALTNLAESRAVPVEPAAGDQLVEVRADLQARLDELETRAREDQVTLRNVVAAEADRLRALEERTELALNRLAQAVEEHGRVRRAAPPPERDEGAFVGGSGFLDDFERQLEQATSRLAVRGRGEPHGGNNGGDGRAVNRPSGGAG